MLLVIALLGLCLLLRSDAPPQMNLRLAALPRMSLWVWEQRADLRPIDPARFAIAYLDQTITIDLEVHRQARRDAIVFPAVTKRIAVVRIETAPHAVLDRVAEEETVQALLASAAEPGLSALQIDFDATLSQRAFYREVLTDLRQRMPTGLPLSITALASWCSYDTWIHTLPVDEAVPMMFRMEPDRRRAPADLDTFKIREPLCQGSIGVSTSEPWPRDVGDKRIYVFADSGWQEQSLARLQRRLP